MVHSGIKHLLNKVNQSNMLYAFCYFPKIGAQKTINFVEGYLKTNLFYSNLDLVLIFPFNCIVQKTITYSASIRHWSSSAPSWRCEGGGGGETFHLKTHATTRALG